MIFYFLFQKKLKLDIFWLATFRPEILRIFQNILELAKNMHFGVGAPGRKYWATAQTSASYLPHFYLEKDFLCPETSAKLFGRFPAGRSKFRPYPTTGW